MFKKIQVRVVYVVAIIMASMIAGMYAQDAYVYVFRTHHTSERYYYGVGVTQSALLAASSEKDEQVNAAKTKETFLKDRAEYGRHGLIQYLNENPFDKETEEMLLKFKGFSPDEIAELLAPIA